MTVLPINVELQQLLLNTQVWVYLLCFCFEYVNCTKGAEFPGSLVVPMPSFFLPVNYTSEEEPDDNVSGTVLIIHVMISLRLRDHKHIQLW